MLVPNSLQAHILGPNRIDSSLEEARTLYIKTLTKSGFYCFEQKIEIDEHIEVPNLSKSDVETQTSLGDGQCVPPFRRLKRRV